MSAPTQDLEKLAQRVAYWHNRIMAARREIQKYHSETVNAITGSLKNGIRKWEFTMHQEALTADLGEAQVEFNMASIAYGNAMRAAMNGQSLHTHDEQERLRSQQAEAAPVSSSKREVPAD